MQTLVPASHRAANECKGCIFVGRHGFGRVHYEEETHGGANLTRTRQRGNRSARDFARLTEMARRAPKTTRDSRLHRMISRPAVVPWCAAFCALGLTFSAPGGHAQGKVAQAAVATENVVSSREAMAE